MTSAKLPKRIRKNAHKMIAGIFNKVAKVYSHSDYSNYVGQEMTVEAMKAWYYEHLKGKSYVEITEDEEKFFIRVTSREWYELYKKEADRHHFDNIEDAFAYAKHQGLRHIAKTQHGTYVATYNTFGYPARATGLFYLAMGEWTPLRQYVD